MIRKLLYTVFAIVLPLTAAALDTGRVFVSNEKSDEVYVFDTDFNLIKKIETSQRPRDMKLNAERTLLYVACGDDDVIDVIDVDTLEVIDEIPTAPAPKFSSSRRTGHRFSSRMKKIR